MKKHIQIETKQITRNGKIYHTTKDCLSGSINFIPENNRNIFQMLKDLKFEDVYSLKSDIEDLRYAFTIKYYPDAYDPNNKEQEYTDITENVMPLLIEELINIFGPMNWRNKTQYARGIEYKKMTQKAIEEIERTGQIKVE